MTKNPSLKDKALADAVAKQNWDPSIQAMAALPDVVKQLAENIAWTSDLGNAFLAQQSDVMDAVQRMRAKAQGAGNLKTSKEQKVESKQVEGKTVVVIEQADPKVVYVPSYNPRRLWSARLSLSVDYYRSTCPETSRLWRGCAIGAAWNGAGVGLRWATTTSTSTSHQHNYINISTNDVNNRISNNSNWQHNARHAAALRIRTDRSRQYGGNVRGVPIPTDR